MLLAQQVRIAQARATFLWPLSLDRGATAPETPTAEIVAAAWAAIAKAKGPWERVFDPACHIAPPTESAATDLVAENIGAQAARQAWQAHALAEAHYFHDFVVDILFPSNPDAADFRLYQRTDLSGMTVTWSAAQGEVTRLLGIERLNLYVFRTGAAVLMLELAAKEPVEWSLADVQDFHERFRRGYAPYAHDDLSPGGIVSRVEIHGDGAVPPFMYSRERHLAAAAAYAPLDGTPARRDAALLGHWLAFLGDAVPMVPADPGQPVWRQIADDRIPALLSISVTDTRSADPMAQYRAIRRGDIIRLCFGDGSGVGAYSYEEAALAEFEERHAYDWFKSVGSRFLISDQSFVAIGAGWFFDSFVHPHHMRRHYFQLALLLHVEMASMLAFSRAISRSSQALQAAGEQKEGAAARKRFDAHMRRLHDDYLQFVHRFHFTGVSHQMQGKALFELWRERVGLPGLFRDLQAEITASNAFLQAEWERERALAAERHAEAANRLASVATLGTALGLPMAFLGMNTVKPTESAGEVKAPGGGSPFEWSGVPDLTITVVPTALVVGGFALLALVTLSVAGLSRRSDPMVPVRVWLGLVAGAAALVAVHALGIRP